MAINYFISSYRVLYVIIWSLLHHFKNVLLNFRQTKSTKHQIKKHFEQWTVEKELRFASAIYSTTFARYDDYEIANEWPRSRRVSSRRIVLWWQSILNKLESFFTKFLTINFPRNDTRILSAVCRLSDLMVHGFLVSLTMELMRLFVARTRYQYA